MVVSIYIKKTMHVQVESFFILGVDFYFNIGYNRIITKQGENMKTFIYESKKYKFKNTEEANDKLPLGNGVWDTREPGAYSCAHNGQYKMNTTHKAWVKGNFFD
jgi:hypothetical protein